VIIIAIYLLCLLGKMPYQLKSHTDLRDRLCTEGKKWRIACKRAKEATNEKVAIAGISDTMVSAFDDLTSAITYVSEAQADTEALVNLHQAGLDLATTQHEQVLKDYGPLSDRVTLIDKKIKELGDLERRIKNNTVANQRSDLDRSANVIIARNIRPIQTARKESYEDLEKAFLHSLKVIKMDKHTHVNHIRRLQKSKDDKSNGPPLMRVVLGSAGEKRKLYDAVNNFIKAGNDFEPAFHNEVPQYALGQHRHLNKLAGHIRQQNPGVRTRISIQKGDLMPVIMIKGADDTQYRKLTDDELKQARAEFIAARKEASASKLLYDDDRMDIDSASTTRAKATRKTAKK